jgi:benzoyl-CoA reductase/2-hydroxyglutaryl-CoA dehydratase subunit BcrC/BadD/HgdB
MSQQQSSQSSELESQLEYIRHSRDVIHAHSPAVQKIFDLALSYIYDAEDAARAGQPAVWSFGLWETPLLYGSGIIPVSFSELGRLGSLETLNTAEDVYQLPVETCSMIKSTIGEWHLRREGPIKRILGFSSVCEPYNLAWEVMQDRGFQVHCIDVIYKGPTCPPERYEDMVSFFVEELRGSVRWLTGREPDNERISAEIKKRNELMRKGRRIVELRHQRPLYIQSLPMTYFLAGLGHYFGKPDQYAQVVDQLLYELENAPQAPCETGSVIPLVWAGGRGQEFGVYQAVDDAGGSILGWVFPSLYPIDYREDLDPVEAIARYYLEGQAAGAGVHRRKVIEQQVGLTKAKGILLYGYLGCSFAGVDREMFREYFHKRGTPAISLEGSFQVGPPTGQLLTRVKAFVEMLS